LVCSDCVPPSTAASACSVTRTTLLSGWRLVSVLPAVWVWKRRRIALAFVAPKRSCMSSAHIRRAARNLAISSKKSLCALKKKDSLPANSSTDSPRSTALCTYCNPLASVKASSCGAVQPASRMWYPLMEIGLKRGMCSWQYAMTSVTRRRLGAGGKR
jgi:hypothetical protein